MCKQCTAQAITIKVNIVPGYALLVATKTTYGWNAERFALVRSNDPDYCFNFDLLPDPTDGMSDEEVENMPKEILEQWFVFQRAVTKMDEALLSDPMEGYRLVTACMAAGYDPKKYGARISGWLMNHIARSVTVP